MRSVVSLSTLTALAVYLSGVNAIVPKPPPSDDVKEAQVSYKGSATFEQLIDHNNPDLGTFSQRYWWSSEFWAGEGSPVVLMTPGEGAADGYQGYLTNRTITGLYAQEIQGAAVIIEHRYWGESSPYSELNAETLQYLTLEQSIADLVHFAKTVDLPFDTNGSSNADKAPWVLSGGSYSGALSAWTEKTSPGTFWAYHSSSAPVQAVYDYWQYFVPIQEGMPVNCSKDVSLVIEYIDFLYVIGDTQKQQEVKEMFGLGALEHYDDFAAAIENGPWLWQSTDFDTGYSEFYKFCDAVENVEAGASATPGPEGVGLEKALKGYASWFNSSYLPGACANFGYWTDEYSIACFDTYDASSPFFTDPAVNNTANRQWNWFLCNEPFAYWQDGAPKFVPSIVSRLVNAEYWQRQCSLFFPEVNGYTYASAKGKTVDDVNAWTGGWSARDTTRLIWTNGQFDPWRESGVSAGFRPGGPLVSTPQAPVQVIPAGVHCSDLLLRNADVNAPLRQVVNNEAAQVKAWVEEYYQK